MNPKPLAQPCRRLLLTTAALWALALPGAHAQSAPKLAVTASFSILGDIVRVVGGERVQVHTLVGPDEDAHVFEPRPAHAKTVLGSQLVVTNGLGFEPWAAKLIRSAGYKGAVVEAARGVAVRSMKAEHGHGAAQQETDPHAWQNPLHGVVYARNIAAALAQADPAGAAHYQANAQAYAQELQALDAWAEQQFAAIPAPQRKVITSHDAFGYLGARYGLRLLAPQGLNTEAEPSAKQVARLVQQIQREKIRAVFIENMSSPTLVAQLAKDAGASVGASLYADALSAPGKPGATYVQMLRHNVSALVAGMRRNGGAP
ncbi:MAG: metal ABC transporter solute-binding protein, Zn/Mn family [Rhodoferax sp.]